MRLILSIPPNKFNEYVLFEIGKILNIIIACIPSIIVMLL